MSIKTNKPKMIVRFSMLISGISKGICRLEALFLKGLLLTLLCLILLNVVTRSLSDSLYWVDELAIYTFIWLIFIGASVAVYENQSIAVTILHDILAPSFRYYLDVFSQLFLAIIALFLFYLSWRWYDLPTLANLNFDIAAFSEKTFNFIYQEPTNTIGIQKFWIWLVVPLSMMTTFIHSTARLVNLLVSGSNNPTSEEK